MHMHGMIDIKKARSIALMIQITYDAKDIHFFENKKMPRKELFANIFNLKVLPLTKASTHSILKIQR